ncbi:MAG: peptidylprolyl isomerase [Planctomycetota bacterium]|jgi:cyclophilin family peptidyl-prolyl cis-trans isomerase
MTGRCKIVALLLALMLIVLMTGCNEKEQAAAEKKTEQKKVETAPKPVEKVAVENTINKKTLPPAGPTRVKLETNKGDIVLELDEKAAPITVANFLGYVNKGFYDNTVFHRVIPGFMIQAGGFGTDSRQKQTHAMIKNEFKLSNLRGTIAMAKQGGNPNSATSQFFINLNDNSGNLDNQNGGFTVFGKVVEGMNIVDSIARVKTGVKNFSPILPDGSFRQYPFQNVPLEQVVIKKASVISGN